MINDSPQNNPNMLLFSEYMKDIRKFQKEIIRLKALCLRAADEIRELEGILIDCVENNKIPQYDEPNPMYAGFSSVNLLNSLEGLTKGDYIGLYENLKLELEDIDKPQENEHTAECKWHKDWHACDCGAFDIEGGQDEQGLTARVEKISEQHSGAFEKLAKSELLDRILDEIEYQCFNEDFGYDRTSMKESIMRILDDQ